MAPRARRSVAARQLRAFQARHFLSYGRRDAEELADRLDQDLSSSVTRSAATSRRSARARTSRRDRRRSPAAPSSSWLCSAPTPSASRATRTALTTWLAPASTDTPRRSPPRDHVRQNVASHGAPPTSQIGAIFSADRADARGYWTFVPSEPRTDAVVYDERATLDWRCSPRGLRRSRKIIHTLNHPFQTCLEVWRSSGSGNWANYFPAIA